MDTTPKTEKTREARLRRMAARQGYRLTKSRRRDPRAVGYQAWFITHVAADVLETSSRGISLNQAEEWLSGSEEDRWDFHALLKGL